MKKLMFSLWIVIGIGLYCLSRYNYVLYHLTIESAICMIGILIFSVSANARSFNKNNLFILLGPGFLVSSLIGLIHTFTYAGMNIIPGYDANLPTQLWIVLSYLLASSFLLTAIINKREINYYAVLLSYCFAGVVLVTLCFLRIFPACYITGQGLTTFKRISEYIIICIYILSLIKLIKSKNLEKGFLKRISTFICVLMLSGFFFTLYYDVYSAFNFLGHYVKLGACFIIYQSLLSDLIVVPYQKILYDSIHNAQTGLYNHKYFFQTIKEKNYTNPTIIKFDIDALKLINDAFGYSKGDQLIYKAGEIIKTSLPDDSFAAHISGGEFAIIIDNTYFEKLTSFIEGFEKNLEKHNIENPECPLSMTYGCSTGHNTDADILEIYQEASENMNAKKILNIKSSHNTLVKTLMKTLETKDFTTKEHANRMVELATSLGRKSGLSEKRLSGIVLFTEFHDIGKIGISDNILLKPGPLNEEETLIMHRHSNLGYEIAISSSDLAHISDFILKHHERWDGKGYPLGLAGEDIPIECRILAIVDAYDAQINDRPYRKGMSSEKALEEIKRCSGTQFDPELVQKFLETV